MQPKESWQRWGALIEECVSNLPVQADPDVRQQRQAAHQQQGPVRLSGRGLHGLLLPLPRVRLTQVRRGVPLRQEVALRAGGGGGRRDHQEQVCCLAVECWRGLGTRPLGWRSSGKGFVWLRDTIGPIWRFSWKSGLKTAMMWDWLFWLLKILLLV